MASVLLVDDDVDTFAAWAAICVADGFEVRRATDGQSALRMFIDFPVDVVVADWRMPVISGSELCHRLRTLPESSRRCFYPDFRRAQPTCLRQLRRVPPQARRWATSIEYDPTSAS
ncbi:PleD family two-component system response regulator [Paraburkholderia sp. UYCP14C]|uniref:response regulator n=1 Tax=Paraburkholderia sp. UYCP14C TaxID=2511130 RepID=UPI0020070E50|nr:response regulator [Paraburkholderia sp. UYCP14C]